MDGLKIRVRTTDGTDATYSLRPRVIVEFEQKYQKGLAKLIAEEQKLEHIYFLAWSAMKDSGKVVKPFGEAFLDTLDSVELETDPNSESTETA